jgi:uncharacterized metal-binding protein YceD (DUF177 family)
MTTPDTPDLLVRPIRLSELGHRTVPFDLVPDADRLAALTEELDLLALKKVRFAGTLRPDGPRDWRLDATLGATVVQPCRVTLKPVTTRIDEPVTRRYLARWEEPAKDEIEMPEDDSAEPLPETLVLGEVLAEALALALPPFPRAEDADEVSLSVTEPGKTAMTDDGAKPFAGLAHLRDKLEKGKD